MLTLFTNIEGFSSYLIHDIKRLPRESDSPFGKRKNTQSYYLYLTQPCNVKHQPVDVSTVAMVMEYTVTERYNAVVNGTETTIVDVFLVNDDIMQIHSDICKWVVLYNIT